MTRLPGDLLEVMEPRYLWTCSPGPGLNDARPIVYLERGSVLLVLSAWADSAHPGIGYYVAPRRRG